MTKYIGKLDYCNVNEIPLNVPSEISVSFQKENCDIGYSVDNLEGIMLSETGP